LGKTKELAGGHECAVLCKADSFVLGYVAR
jgi:hypothetical protein